VIDDVARRAIAVDQANRSLGAEVFAACGAVFVRNRSLPMIHDLNHVGVVRTADPSAIDALMARVEREYTGYGHRLFVLDPETPAAVEARLVLDGYDEVEASLLMLLEGALRGTPPQHRIREVTTPADWEAYGRLKRLDWAERAARLGLGPLPDVAEGLVRTYRLKVPPLRYWLALVDGEPRGFFSSWEGPDGVGQVEDLFVEAPWRHRGLATALVHHAVADCRRHGARAVVIVADATDTPKRMYAAMGFRPVAVVRKYRRRMPAGKVPPPSRPTGE
jgi:GNAT superfamily N-acetyltransferase